MKILALLHVSFEGLGAIDDWVQAHSHDLTVVRAYQGETFPEDDAFDFLIIMGGPQSAVSIAQYPYLQDEVALIKRAVQLNKRVLGICLGAQLIAAALGAPAQKSPHKEVGVYPIQVLEAGRRDPVFERLPAAFDVFHWHNDMPSIPDGAVLLAKSAGCPHQAFRYGDRVYGFQCHLELKKENIERLIKHCPEDLLPGEYIRTSSELLSSDFDAINEKLFSVLDAMALLT